MPNKWIDSNLVSYLKDIMYHSGEMSLGLRQKGLSYSKKSDGSFVSNADIAVSDYIYSKLLNLKNDQPIICEEKVDFSKEYKFQEDDFFWLIDPIDGTNNYIRNKDNFTVNICLIHQYKPLIGFILHPITSTLHYCDENNNLIIEKDHQKVTYTDLAEANFADYYTAVISSNHMNTATEEYILQNNLSRIIPIGSSIKFCFVADGRADIYPKFGSTMEWDTAAGHAIINASGGKVVDLRGEEILYGKKDFKNGNFIAMSKRWASMRN